MPGWRSFLLVGERGPRAGKYAWLQQIESVAARDEFFPEDGRQPDPWEHWMAEHPSLRQAVDRTWELVASQVTTDYLIVG